MKHSSYTSMRLWCKTEHRILCRILHRIRHRIRYTNYYIVYDIVYDIVGWPSMSYPDLRCRILSIYDVVSDIAYDMQNDTSYTISYTMSYVNLRCRIRCTKNLRHRRSRILFLPVATYDVVYDVVYDIVGHTYDIVGFMRRRRWEDCSCQSHFATSYTTS